ncbi:hypothetical protein [Bacillus sonorensis]|nr:hypothetical protein [Bacillus sonorensis]
MDVIEKKSSSAASALIKEKTQHEIAKELGIFAEHMSGLVT